MGDSEAAAVGPRPPPKWRPPNEIGVPSDFRRLQVRKIQSQAEDCNAPPQATVRTADFRSSLFPRQPNRPSQRR